MIVPIAEEHVEGLHAALDSVAREHDYLAFLEAPPLEDVRKFVLENIRTRRPQVVALAGSSVVGWCDVLPNPRPALRHGGTLGIGVVREHRGRGIGAALMAAALGAARAAGLSRIELTVRVDNVRAKRLYERFGFATEGLCRRHMLVDGQFRDSYLMAWIDEAAAR